MLTLPMIFGLNCDLECKFSRLKGEMEKSNFHSHKSYLTREAIEWLDGRMARQIDTQDGLLDSLLV